MNDKEMILKMHIKYSEQISGLFSRRQIDNRYFLTICLALFSALGWMLQNNAFIKENQNLMAISAFIGIMIAISWFATMRHYSRALKSTYDILRHLEFEAILYPLYRKDHEFRLGQANYKSILNFFRHYVPILSFFIAFCFFLISAYMISN